MKNYYLIFSLVLTFVFWGTANEVAAQSRKQLDEARNLVVQGDQFYRRKEYESALQNYDAAVKIAPKFAIAHFSRGLTLYHLNNFDEAITALQSALSNGYAANDIYKIRWEVYRSKKDYTNALADIDRMIAAEPKNAVWYIAAGDVFSEQSMYEKSIESYNKASEIDTRNGDLYYYIARNYAKTGAGLSQRSAAQRAIDNSTKFAAESYVLIAESYEKENNLTETVAAYEKALTTKPDLMPLYDKLLSFYQSSLQYDKAIALMQRAIKLYPEDSNFYYKLSRLYTITDKRGEAVVASVNAVKFAPEDFAMHKNLCRAYNDAAQYLAAFDSCQRALKLKPGDGETHFYLARALEFKKADAAAQDNYKKAVQGLIEYTKENPNDEDGFLFLGNSYFAIGQLADAISNFKRALQLNPKMTRAMFNLAVAYHRNADKAAAKSMYEKLKTIDANLAQRLLTVINN